MERDESGRIIAPALWNKDLNKLAFNYGLAKKILDSTLSKLKRNDKALNDIITQQLSDGIIERGENPDTFPRSNANVSFIPHSAGI